jgi:hypothetical protein
MDSLSAILRNFSPRNAPVKCSARQALPARSTDTRPPGSIKLNSLEN